MRDIKPNRKRNPKPYSRSSALKVSFGGCGPNYSNSNYSTPVAKTPMFSTLSRGKKMAEMAMAKVTNPNFKDSGKPKPKLSPEEAQFDNDRVAVMDSYSDVEILPKPPSPKLDIELERINSIIKVLEIQLERVNSIIKVSEIPLVRVCGIMRVFDTVKDSLKNLCHRTQKYKNDLAKYENDMHLEELWTEFISDYHAEQLEDQMVECLFDEDDGIPVPIAEAGVFPELSAEADEQISHALSKEANPDEVLTQKFGLSITRQAIQTLARFNCLNDEVINFYMNLLIERGKDSKWPKTYAMNTFFYPKLLKDGPSSLRRWTRNVDIFAHDLVVVPIHLDMQAHWCMCIIDFRNHSIRYYDSLGNANRQCLEALRNYLKAEHLDKKKEEYDVSDWSLENMQNIPLQTSGNDCGMFSCTFAEFITRNGKITFSQEDMPYLRRKMVFEILLGELLLN